MIITPANQFYTEKRKDNLEKLSIFFKNKDTPYLKIAINKISKQPADKNRVATLAISFELSNRGLAPPWQGLLDVCEEDKPLIDLYWLSITFPKHKANNKRWQQIFSSGFDLELAISIGKRQIHTASKVRHELELTKLQQITCIHFLSKNKYTKDNTKSFIESAQRRSETAYKREIDRAAAVPQITEEVARQRALIWQCWLLADKSPTNAARLYGWMTGNKTDKGTINKTIKRMKQPVSRRIVDKSVDR